MNPNPQVVNSPAPTLSEQEVLPEQPQATRSEEPSTGLVYDGNLELPVIGATGYASVRMELKNSADVNSITVAIIEPRSAFQILKEEGAWWLVQHQDVTGWLPHVYCFINLPDVIPSMIYDNTNTYASQFKSSGKAIPGITDQKLYSGKSYNNRLAKEEFIDPVLYQMSKKYTPHSAWLYLMETR